MKFKEFVNWCNERACDGCWGTLTAMACIDLIGEVKKPHFGKEKNSGKKIMSSRYWKRLLIQ